MGKFFKVHARYVAFVVGKRRKMQYYCVVPRRDALRRALVWSTNFSNYRRNVLLSVDERRDEREPVEMQTYFFAIFPPGIPLSSSCSVDERARVTSSERKRFRSACPFFVIYIKK